MQELFLPLRPPYQVFDLKTLYWARWYLVLGAITGLYSHHWILSLSFVASDWAQKLYNQAMIYIGGFFESLFLGACMGKSHLNIREPSVILVPEGGIRLKV